MADRIQFRRDTAANWSTFNPILADGEIGIDTDTQRFKMGNGLKAWSELIYNTTHMAEDPVGLVSRLSTANITYTVDNTIDTITYTTGHKAVYTYDDRKYLMSIKYYEEDGTTLVVTQQFTYDLSNRLISDILV